MPNNNLIYVVAGMQVFHLLSAAYRRQALQPTHRTTKVEIEILHMNCRNFDRLVPLCRKDF